MSDDPELVARAVVSVREAMKGWQAAAQDAVVAGRGEHQATSALVERSGRAAMEVRRDLEDLADALARLGSELEAARGGLLAAVAAVEARARRHEELMDQVRQGHQAWSGHQWRAERDHQAAQERRVVASQALWAAETRQAAAEVQLQRATSEVELARALAEMRQAETYYGDAYRQHQQCVREEKEQQARVERCTRGLELASEAVATLEAPARDVAAATAAVASAQGQLADVEAAMQTARAHLDRMTQHAEEVISHANRADQDLGTASQHLSEVEDWQQRGHLLAMDARDQMTDILQQLHRIDAPMGGGSEAVRAHRNPRMTCSPKVKAGSADGETAGRRFAQFVRQQALGQNPGTCVYCHMRTNSPQVDHAIPRIRGGNATFDNAQVTCGWCNASKGGRDTPVTPPRGYRGAWPPPWWKTDEERSNG